jgi:hypothetical protein
VNSLEECTWYHEIILVYVWLLNFVVGNLGHNVEMRCFRVKCVFTLYKRILVKHERGGVCIEELRSVAVHRVIQVWQWRKKSIIHHVVVMFLYPPDGIFLEPWWGPIEKLTISYIVLWQWADKCTYLARHHKIRCLNIFHWTQLYTIRRYTADVRPRWDLYICMTNIFVCMIRTVVNNYNTWNS